MKYFTKITATSNKYVKSNKLKFDTSCDIAIIIGIRSNKIVATSIFLFFIMNYPFYYNNINITHLLLNLSFFCLQIATFYAFFTFILNELLKI